jgi:hypothetical protein
MAGLFHNFCMANTKPRVGPSYLDCLGPALGAVLGVCFAELWWDWLSGSILDEWSPWRRPEYSVLVSICGVSGSLIGLGLARFPALIWPLVVGVLLAVSFTHWYGVSWEWCIEIEGGHRIEQEPLWSQITQSSLPGLLAGSMVLFAAAFLRLLAPAAASKPGGPSQ